MAWPTQNKMGKSRDSSGYYPKNTPMSSTQPAGVSPSTVKGKTQVAGAQARKVSSAKSADNMGGVQLGVTHGNHNVAHRISGSKNQGPGQKPRGNTV